MSQTPRSPSDFRLSGPRLSTFRRARARPGHDEAPVWERSRAGAFLRFAVERRLRGLEGVDRAAPTQRIGLLAPGVCHGVR